MCATFRSTGNRRKHQEISPQETQKSAKKCYISSNRYNIIYLVYNIYYILEVFRVPDGSPSGLLTSSFVPFGHSVTHTIAVTAVLNNKRGRRERGS